MWPELDGLLRDEEDGPAAALPYKVAVPEYRVVMWESGIKLWEDTYAPKLNGQAIYDVNHPCRWGQTPIFLLFSLTISLSISFIWLEP